MNPRSLAYRTDLMFFRRAPAWIADRGDHLAIHSPQNPTFHWGNFLLFPTPPGEGDFERWVARFEAEFASEPEVRHRTFGWDSTGGEMGRIAPFLAAGYQLEDSVVLTASKVEAPPQLNEALEVRVLAGDEDWEAATQNQIRCRGPDFEEKAYALYKRREMAFKRQLVNEGLGQWFGAFQDGRLVGDLGLYVEDRVGRFQMVGTAPEARRQGVCRSLVHAAARFGLERMGAQVLVIVAKRGAPVTRVYGSVGFLPTERQMGVSWWGKGHVGASAQG